MGLVEWRSGLGSIASQRQTPLGQLIQPSQPVARLGLGHEWEQSTWTGSRVTQLCRPVGYLHTYSKSNTLRCRCTSGDLLSLRSCVLDPKVTSGGMENGGRARTSFADGTSQTLNAARRRMAPPANWPLF